MRASRKFSWFASVDKQNENRLRKLSEQMAAYYAGNQHYYSDVDFTKDNWRDNDIYQYITEVLRRQQSILEVGCGKANLLQHHAHFEPRYHGLDFSPQLIAANQRQFPLARFIALQNATSFPVQDETHDCVFSVFVLEHCVFPHMFLDECSRVLKPGGSFVILCPDMLGRSRMTSQRVGFTVGTGRQKLSSGRWFDGLVTGWDTRVRMVFATWLRRLIATRQPRFYVNTAPLCFSESFQPDFDAVYLTHKAEILNYLATRIRWLTLPGEISKLCNAHGLILVHGVKCEDAASNATTIDQEVGI